MSKKKEITKKEQEHLLDAEKWFALQNIPTIVSGGRMFPKVGNFEFEITKEEVVHRALLYNLNKRQKKRGGKELEVNQMHKKVN